MIVASFPFRSFLVSALLVTGFAASALAQANTCGKDVSLGECSRQQDCSQFQQLGVCAPGEAACETLKKSFNSLIAAQQKSCEAQNERLREICEISRLALNAANARCRSQDKPLPQPGSLSLWEHNGSVVRLQADGARRGFIYESPRAALINLGVQKGTLLFEGKKEGNSYIGTAYIFSARCPSRPYEAAGPIADDQRQVTLYGEVVRVDQDCKDVQPPRNDVLTFTFLGE